MAGGGGGGGGGGGAAAAVDPAALREAIGKLLPSKDLSTTSIKALRAELEEVLGVGPGGLEGQRELVRELLQEEICSIQQQPEAAERPAKRPVVDPDAPLVALASVEDLGLGDTTSDSDQEEPQRERKSKKAKRHHSAKGSRMARAAPTPLRQRGPPGESAGAKRKGNPAAKTSSEGKASRFKSKVEKAVQQYTCEHPDDWTVSEMREDIANRHGWENDTRLASMVKNTLLDLGYTSSGANVLKGAR